MKIITKILLLSFSICIFISSLFAQTTRWRLIWDPNTEDNMAYYRIYRDTHPSATKQIDTTNHPHTEYIDSDIEPGIRYYYRLKAVDAENDSSFFSEEVSGAIPKIDIPAITIYENQIIYLDTLDKYVEDPDHADNQIVWDAPSTTNLNINIENRILTITRINTNWYGTENVIFTATDPDTFYDVQSVEITVVNEELKFEPVVHNIPDQTIWQGESFKDINLDDYITDQDHEVSEINWTYTGNTDLIVEIDADRIASISPPNTNWIGSESITFIATDPDAQSDSDWAKFTIQPQNAPIVSDIPDQTIEQGLSFADISLDDYVEDPDHNDDEIIWFFTGNTNLSVTINENRIASINYPTDWTGNETITFRATDPDNLFDEDIATFTVELNPSKVDNKITAFPIPFRTSQGLSNITFRNLPIGGKLIIYDLLGYPVYKTDITSTEYPWRTTNQNGKWVRSGIYLYVVKDQKGEKVKSDKVIIIR